MSTGGADDRLELLQGTLDLLVLRTLRLGPTHGHAIMKAIRQSSDDMLQVEQGSLYPALHRLIKRGWIAFDRGTSENNRRAKYYRLTPKGRKQLAVETTKWEKLVRAIARRLEAGVTQRRRNLERLDADIRDHIDRETQDNIDRGMTSDDAREAALRAFGNVALTLEDTRAVWIPVWIDQLAQDARYALRMLRRSVSFCTVAILTLAIGIGLSTAVFSVVNAVLLRPLSYAHADRVYWLGTYDDRAPIEYVSSLEFVAWREHATSLEQLAGFFTAAEPIDTGPEVIQARIGAVTDGFWELTGARFTLGGPPRAGEDGVVLSHAFFEHRFRGDPAIVGRLVTSDGVPTPVTGVLVPGFRAQLPPPPTFSGIGAGEVDYYRSVVLRPASAASGILIFNVIARAKPGVSVTRVKEEIEAIRAQQRAMSPGLPFPPRLRVAPYADTLVGAVRRPLLILLAAALLVLTLTCANVANLLLARGAARQREIAIRVAIGAGRGRVVRQFLVESLLLATAGGVLGLLVARAAIAVVLELIPRAVPRLAEASIDGYALTFAAVASAVTAVVFGFAPAIGLWKTSVHDLLKHGTCTASAAAGALRGRKALVSLELAVSVVLLIGAGLLVRSVERITVYPPGFEPDRVLTLRVQFSGPRYREVTARRAHAAELLERARRAPGVEAVGLSSNGETRMRLQVEGTPAAPRGQGPSVVVSAASAGYAPAIGMQIVRGRWLSDDEPQPAFVINEALARQAFPDGDPIGRRIRIPGPGDPRFGAIVGVAADLRYANLDVRPEPELFIDYADASMSGVTLAIRTAGDPASAAPTIRTLLGAVDPTQPLFDVRPLEAALADSIAPRRFTMLLLVAFAVTAMLLALIGIYGVIAYAVAQRTHEIGYASPSGRSAVRWFGWSCGKAWQSRRLVFCWGLLRRSP